MVIAYSLMFTLVTHFLTLSGMLCSQLFVSIFAVDFCSVLSSCLHVTFDKRRGTLTCRDSQTREILGVTCSFSNGYGTLAASTIFIHDNAVGL